jgi:superfamily II DNA helicase RecQ
MIVLKDVLKEQLCIKNTQVFQQNTLQKTIWYKVRDSKDKAPSDIAIKYVQQMILGPRQQGVIYVQSYETRRVISSVLECLFYRARANDKEEVLQQ